MEFLIERHGRSGRVIREGLGGRLDLVYCTNPDRRKFPDRIAAENFMVENGLSPVDYWVAEHVFLGK